MTRPTSMHATNEMEVRQQLRDRVEKIKFCMLTTVEPDGTMVMRRSLT